jgi:predicted DNA-binding transcriptional regulator YafY
MSEREVDVLVVHNNLGEWYAVCYDHLRKAVRDFHVGRIMSIRETNRRFEPPDGWDADEYLKRGFGMFRGGKAVTIEVEFDEYQARYARERKFHATERRREMRDGRLQISFETTENALEQVARWLMGFGEHARALRPESLRRMMAQRLSKTAGFYDDAVGGVDVNEQTNKRVADDE